MALTLTSSHFRFQPFLTRTNYVFFSDFIEHQVHDSITLLRRSKISVNSPPALKPVKCSRSTEEKQWNDAETVASDSDEAVDDSISQAPSRTSSIETQRISTTSSGDSLSLGIREPVYEVVEVKLDGTVSTRKINRKQLLKSSGLRPRDVRSVDPSLFLTNSMPSLLVREYAILLNLGSLRAIAMKDCVLIFDYNRKGGQAFLESLLPRLNPKNNNGGPSMPFEIEEYYCEPFSTLPLVIMVELSGCRSSIAFKNTTFGAETDGLRTSCEYGNTVQALLEALPNRITGDILEQLRISKQTLVELGSRAGALRQMLLDLLEDPNEIRRICIMGRNCTLNKGNNNVECSVPLEKQVADEEEEEIEMLLENYLQRCESCHGQAERLLDSAREMEDSIAVSLSSRRLEVSRFELLLQVGTFCVAVGALVAGLLGFRILSFQFDLKKERVD
ncbi:hypothetical protein TSUD_103150 [Trifolium subterraneum]|uniref:Magnesium transporter n=1 Tax=Trifolium subterraneum TaxID=3900 RepID=A0A2Z6MYM1_TRISU|nr:hypothetical protein TSUD_103150 [Trifolium subterraneum]